MIGTFHSIWKFEVLEVAIWSARAQDALQVLQLQPGFLRASIMHSADETRLYLVQTDWQDVGSYRRALGSMEAKLGVWPLLADMQDEATAFEKLLEMNVNDVTRFETSVHDGS
ncbi:MAG: antibiotic biosynthesis monooxygenase [Actinomycetes bacterium]|jgi:hypothetical protein